MHLKSIENLHLPAFLPYLPAAVSGVLLSLSFPDPGFHWLVFIALIPFFTSISSMDHRQACISGIILGMVHYIFLLYWIVPTLCSFGNLPFLASASTLILLALYLALYPGIFSLGWKILNPGPMKGPVTGACLWVMLEFVRSCAFTGFPWGILGYSQYSQTEILQTADLFGVLGISFFIVWINISLAQTWSWLISGHRTHKYGSMAISTILSLALCMAVWGYGTHRIAQLDREMKKSPDIRVALIQGNIDQHEKWESSMIPFAIDTYGSLSLEAAQYQPDLIIWPETALPFYYKQEPLYSPKVDEYIQKANIPFIIGTLGMKAPKDARIRVFNRAMMVNPQGQTMGIHDKYHLVPFGEYIPMEPILGYLGKLIAQAGDFCAGPGDFSTLPFEISRSESSKSSSCHAGILICFEILFPSLSGKFVLNQSDILVTITNDAWFGRTSAAAQHFSIAVLRAVENRRSIARAANTGISGHIDPGGRILGQTNIYEQAILIAPVPVLKNMTIYTRYPFLLPLGASLALLTAGVVKIRTKK